MKNFNHYEKVDLPVGPYFKGTVTAVKWNSNDEPTHFSLYTYEGKEYLLKSVQDNVKLSDFNNKEVLIVGSVFPSYEFDQILYFSSITLIKDPMVPPSTSYDFELDDEDEYRLMIGNQANQEFAQNLLLA
ncbi:MAG: hypothetical protein U0T83_07055 [Bacteriovoracaceae bacterium]